MWQSALETLQLESVNMAAQQGLKLTELALGECYIQLEAGQRRKRDIQTMLDRDEIVLHNILGTDPSNFQQLMIQASSTLLTRMMPNPVPHPNGWVLEDVSKYHWRILEGLRTMEAVKEEIARILQRIETLEAYIDRLRGSLGFYS